MSGLVKKIKAYLRLIRVHTVIATALTPSLGAFATFSILEGELLPWDKIPIIFSLFFVGMISHIFGEILNDYMDYDIDKASKELKEKPLVSGDVSKKGALLGLFGSLIFLIAVILFSHFNILEYSILSVIMLFIAALTGILYQIISKKWLHSAVLLGLYAFFVILFGAAYAGGYNNLFNVPPLVYILCILGFFQLWTNTAVLGHLKDIKNDCEFGVKTFPMIFGVKVKGGGKTPKLIIPMNFRLMIVAIQILNLIVAFIPIVFYKIFYDGSINVFLLFSGLAILSFMILFSQIKVMWFKIF